MTRFPTILAASCAAIALTSSLALAAEPAQSPVPAHHGALWAHGFAPGGATGPMDPLAQLPPEKQEAARTLMNAHAKAMAPLHQDLYAKMAALEALNAAGDGEGAKAKAVIRDIADLNAKMLLENGKFRTRMIRETGLRVPLMGHGPRHGPRHGMMRGMGQMGGMDCGMMAKHGAPVPPPPADPDADAAGTPAAPGHTAHH